MWIETARVLAQHGAAVILACRDVAKAKDAATRIIATAPKAAVTAVHLDLASLASVRAAAEEIQASHDTLDLLINNAGLMMPPRGVTADGFELQIGTNHLGHFALTGLLLGRLLAVEGFARPPTRRPAAASTTVRTAASSSRAILAGCNRMRALTTRTRSAGSGRNRNG